MEDNKIIDVNKEALKKKWWEFKHDAEIKVRNGLNWVREHKELCMAAVPVVIELGKGGMKLMHKSKQQKLVEEQRRRLWDPRKGRFSYYRRELSNKEWDYIDREYEKGRSYRDILAEMGLLK